MKAVLAFIVAALALFGLAFGKPLTDGTEEESFAIANEYEEQEAPPGLQEAFEDEEVPKNDAATTSNDNRITEQIFKPITCLLCIHTKPNRLGHSSRALCYRCSDNRSKYWRVCYSCYSSGGSYGIYDSYYSFCARCYK